MKKFLLIIALPVILFGCQKVSKTSSPTLSSGLCNEKASLDLVSIKCFDRNRSSLHFKEVVAEISIKKEGITRSGDCLTKPYTECKNYISIKNLTNKKISFSYTLDFRLNANNAQYTNSAVIGKRAVTADEIMNINCVDPHLAVIAVTTGVITYE